jgi:hypothetical protein
MAVQIGKDGELVLTLDDDFNLSTDALRTLGLDTYGARKNTPGGILKDSNLAPFIFPEGTNKGLSALVNSSMLPTVPEELSEAEEKELLLKKLDKELNPPNAIDEFIDRTINPMKEFITEDIPDAFANADGNELLKKILPDSYIEDIISKKPKVDGVPGSDQELNIFDMFKILQKDAIDKRKEKERMTFPEKNIDVKGTVFEDLPENIISDTKVSNEKKEEKVDKKGDDKKEPTPEKDDRTKIGKIMDGLLNKDDFLMDLGLRLLEGEGLFPSAIKAAKVQKEADTEDKKAELEALELASKLRYNTALANQAEAYAIKAGLPSEKVQEAQIRGIAEAARLGLEPGDDGYDAAYLDGFIKSLDKEDLNPFLKNIDDALMFEMFKDRFPQLADYVRSQGGGQTTAGTTGTFDSPVGPVTLNINDYLK